MNTRPTHVAVVVVVIAAILFVARPADGVASAHGSASVVWSAPVSDGPMDVAADSRGVVVTTTGPGVRALDRNGHQQWSVHVDGLVEAAPALGAHLVLVGGEGVVTALSRADGSVAWRQPTGEAVYSVAMSGTTALAGDRQGTLSAFDAETGAMRWSVHHPGGLWSGPRVDRATGSVVATWHDATAPAARVFDLVSGALRWEAPTGASTAAPAVRKGLVVLAIGDGYRHARVEARTLATGDLRWQTPVPASFEEGIEPAIDDHEVVVVDHFGVVSLLDLATGRLRWQHDLASALLRTRLDLTPSRVVFSSFSGDVFVLDRRDGALVAQLGRRRLGGYTVATLRPRWRGARGLLVALRLDTWGVQLRRLP